MASCEDDYDEDFCDATMKFLDLEVTVKGAENLPKDEKLVFAMNHPLAGLDAIVPLFLV